MKDIYERLRESADLYDQQGLRADFEHGCMLSEAADEIEHLRKIIERVALMRLDLESENIRLRKIERAAKNMRHVIDRYLNGHASKVELRGAQHELESARVAAHLNTGGDDDQTDSN